MKEITTTYTVTLDGEKYTYTDTFEVLNVREAHWEILYHWSGAGKIEFISDVEK